MKNSTIIFSILLCFFINFQEAKGQSQTDIKELKSHDKIEVQNIAIIKRVYKELNTNKNVQILDELYDSEYKGYSPSNSNKPLSLEQAKQSYLWYFRSFPDLEFIIKDIFADGDYVIVRSVFRGTLEGNYYEIKAKGNKIESGEIVIYKLKNGKIVEERYEQNKKDFEKQLKYNTPKGWYLGISSDDFDGGLEKDMSHEGKNSAYLASIGEDIKKFSTILQGCSAAPFKGKKIKMTGFAKSENIEGWAGFWFRIDGEDIKKNLGFDNMQDRPIKGTTDWTKYEIVMEVPNESISLVYGALLSGKGKIWVDNITFEEVTDDESKPTKYITEGPVNTSFEE
jgi:predicted ester cyclase